jgi:hypothetical protein
MRFHRSRAAALILITLLSTAAVLYHRLPRLSDPLHSDEAAELLMAQTQKSGGVIYRDQWNSHAPGIFFLLAALPESLLRSEAGLRLVSVAALGAAVLFLTDLCLAAGAGFGAAATGAGVFVLLNCNTYLQNQWLEAEQVMAALLAAALWALVVRRSTGLAWLLFGAGLMFKQSFAAWLPFFAALDWMTTERGNLTLLRAWLARGMVAVPALLFAGYFLARGAYPDFWRSTVSDGLQHAQWMSGTPNCGNWYFPLRLLLLKNSTAQTQSLLAGLGGCLLAALALDRDCFLAGAGRRLLTAAGVLLAGGILFLKIQGCGRIYYLEMLYPVAFLLTAWASHWSSARLLAKPAPLGRLIGGGGLLVIALGIIVLAGTFNRQPPQDRWSQRLGQERFLARQLPVRFPGHRIYSFTPGLYWYSGQSPPKFSWIADLLENFPSRREEIYRDMVEYGRGRRLLLLFNRANRSPAYPETMKFMGRIQAAGATRFEDGMPVDSRLLALYELYEWDLTGCGTLPASCPSAQLHADPG